MLQENGSESVGKPAGIGGKVSDGAGIGEEEARIDEEGKEAMGSDTYRASPAHTPYPTLHLIS